MGFYGNKLAVANAAKTQFTFDRIYANRYEMDLHSQEDGVYIGRYVLVEYGISDNMIGHLVYLKPDTNPEKPQEFYTSPDFEPMTRIQYTTKDNTDVAVKIGTIIQIEAKDGEKSFKAFYICNGYIEDTPGGEEGEDINLTPDLVKYATFKKVTTDLGNDYTKNYAIDLAYYTNNNGGKGYDSTVWQKVYVNDMEQYVNIAELNSVVPTFDVAFDAPTIYPITPHFDTDSTSVYYKLHTQPSWGFRVKYAQAEHGKEGDSLDVSEYPSDETVNIVDANVYYPDRGYESPQRYEYAGAIYYNKDGFNSEKRSFSEEDNVIKITPTGISGQRYNTHNDNPLDSESRADIQELTFMLPGIGNAVSQLWDLAYGDEEATQSETRNLNIDWGSTGGLRLVNSSKGGFSYSPEQTKCIAGCINSVHDLMGMIVSDEEDISLDDALFDKIYYRDNKYYYKDIGYEYTPVEDYSEIIGKQQYNPINLIGFTPEGRYTLFNRDYYPADVFVDHTTYYKVLNTTPVELDEADFNDSELKFYYADDDNYILKTEKIPVENRQYLTIKENKYNNPLEDHLWSGKYSDWYYEDQREVPVGSGNFITFYRHSQSEGKFVEGKQYYIIDYIQGGSWVIDSVTGDLIPGSQLDITSKTPISVIEFDPNNEYYYKDENNNYIHLDDLIDVEEGTTYYLLTTEDRKPFYAPDRYYYFTEDDGIYHYGDEPEKLEYPYCFIETEKEVGIYYKPNKYYYQPDAIAQPETYCLDTDDFNIDDEGKMVQYFEKIDVYVLSDSSGILPPYSVWNTSITEIPESIQLAYRKEIPIWSELIGFARSLNTINGLIMRINHLMEFEDIETRDNTTAMGVINQMRDIITHFSKLIPEQLTVVDNYGRITSAKVDSKQDVSIVDYTTGNETAPIEKENAWIKVEVDGDPVAPLISITHTTNESYDNSGSSEDLNNSKATEINLFTPKVDNAGHIVGSNTNTITLPSGYQTFKDSNDPIGISTASTPYDTITLIGDNWINPIVSKDTITLNHLNPVITEFVQKPNETPQFGSTFIIDDYYYDDNGHKFAESSHTIQIPKVSLIDNASNEADVITKLILVPETGTFTSVRTNIGDLKLTGYTLPTAISGTISAEDTLNIALGKLKFELDKEIADRTTAISTGIGALDVEDSAVNSQYVSSVSEVDGKINVVRESATNLVLTGYTTTTDITEISATDTIGRAFSLLQNQILNFNNRIKALEDAGYITNASLVDYAKSTDVISKVIYEQKITELEEKITKLEEALAINHPVTEEPETPPI